MVSSSSLTNYETTVTAKSVVNGMNGATTTANGKISYSNGQSSSATMPTGSKQIFARNSFNGPKNLNSGTNLGRSTYFNNSSNKGIHVDTSRDNFNTSVSSNPTEFYFRTLLRYVRSGAEENYAEKLEFLLKQCPTIPTNKSSMASNSNSMQANNINNNTNTSSYMNNGSSSNATYSSTGSPLNTVSLKCVKNLNSFRRRIFSYL